MAGPGANLTATDLEILSVLAARNAELRAICCTIARLGVRWRRLEKARCSEWLEQLETHPFYKAGQVLFDLLEWEDFMLDGEVEIASTTAILGYANLFLSRLGLQSPSLELPDDLPELEAGFYLYRDVVLGLVWLGLQGGSAVLQTGLDG